MKTPTSTKRKLEKALAGYRKKQGVTAKKFKRDKNIVSGVSTVTGLAASAATPAVATAAGLGTAATAGTATLAMAFPVGTLIVAVPAMVSLGFMAGKGALEKQAQYLTRDQKLLAELIKKYKRKKKSTRISLAKKLLKKYSKHLDEGNKKTWQLHDGNRRYKQNKGWKAKKAEYEMKMMAVYVATYQKNPPTKPLKKKYKKKSRRVISIIQTKQRASMDPKTSPLFIMKNGKVVLDKELLQKQANRTLQRPTEYSDMIRQREPAPPQTVYKTMSNASESGVTLPPGAQRELQKAFNLGQALKTAGLRPDQKKVDSKTGKTTQYFTLGLGVLVLTAAGFYIIKNKQNPQGQIPDGTQ
tara:strand:+ start:349 stop:1416 length:1068 start_codon:yes stop_codon:yes gene_type:complete